MTRKMKAALRLVALVSIALVALSSCFLADLFGPEVDPVTPAQRIYSFEDELNKADRSEAYLILHPTRTADYNAWKDPVLWDDAFPVRAAGDPEYAINTFDPTDPTNGTLTVSGGPVAFNGPKDYLVVMAEDGEDVWMIESLSYEDGTPLIE